MKSNIALFLATFAVGAIIAFGARAALHEPHAATTGTAHTASERSSMVSNALTPATRPADGSAAAHAGHVATAATTATPPNAATAASSDQHNHTTPAKTLAATETVNTRCAICGMPVDRNLTTEEYQGEKIGFGCKMCAPKFKADPDKYGPIYLRNDVIKR